MLQAIPSPIMPHLEDVNGEGIDQKKEHRG
jgi:hypothetical protein